MAEEKTVFVLVVEDDLIFSSRMASALHSLGYSYAMAGSASEVREQAQAQLPAVVLLNLSHPRIDSIALIREWKGSEELSHMPIIGYVGHMEAEAQQEALEAGCDRVVANSVVATGLGRLLADLLKN